jgi:hypothetical protein
MMIIACVHDGNKKTSLTRMNHDSTSHDSTKMMINFAIATKGSNVKGEFVNHSKNTNRHDAQFLVL